MGRGKEGGDGIVMKVDGRKGDVKGEVGML